jgi:hypothetical protein
VRERIALGAVILACIAGAGAYVLIAAGGEPPAAATLPSQSAAANPSGGAKPLRPGLRIAVRAVDRRDPRLPGRVSVIDPARPKARRDYGTACMRIYAAGGQGLCLYLARSGVEYRAAFLDRRFRVRGSMAITGVPSRARVSRDGRYGAFTTFVTGDSYTAPGQFSTRTTIVDMAAGKAITDLERFTVTQDGRTVDAVDHNFWGVTFAADSDRFYATLGTGDHHWLVEGSVRERRMRIIRDGVECPSLSPDGTRIAYKRPVDGRGTWRLAVLDLRTLRAHDLAEARSIDDQAEWLDDDHVAYSDGADVWAVQADGGGAPERLVRGAQSPASMTG